MYVVWNRYISLKILPVGMVHRLNLSKKLQMFAVHEPWTSSPPTINVFLDCVLVLLMIFLFTFLVSH